jgi:hypothetical protein
LHHYSRFAPNSSTFSVAQSNSKSPTVILAELNIVYN